ncbi:hypothetical protein NDN08_002923 [Rhodosorus marinus]|uniref:Protein kinase domain-containing protein n=1 Tax=Rhodosorus marinus TaxID=101924 RepID=A0AAV8UV59_9RHOD|nr:hypothetical protein NDN08_002923 [Rhodosorus marinus]
MQGLRNGVPLECSGWLKSGRFGKRRFFRLNGIMLTKHKGPDDEPDWSCAMLNCEILVHREKLRMHIPRWKLLFTAETAESFDIWVKALMESSTRELTNYYELLEVIGEGTSGIVRKAKSKCTGDTVAVKIVSKEGLSPERIHRLHCEAAIMLVVRSPQIVSTIDIFDSEDKVYVVMEYLTAGTLDECLAKRPQVTESQLRMIMNEIVYGLAALHSLRIVHRDIKLENIACEFETFPMGAKLLDFGFGAIIPDASDMSNALSTMLGTWMYLAPEQVNRKPYGASVDLWAAGVLMYKCVTGKFPFEAESPNKVMRLIRTGKYAYGSEWKSYSSRSRDFISKLLEPDAEARMTAVEALAHPWIAGEEKGLTFVNEDPVSDQLRAVQEMVRHAKLMFLTGGLPIGQGDHRETASTGSGDKDARYGSVPDVSPSSPASFISKYDNQTKKRPSGGGMSGIFMMGINKGFTPPTQSNKGFTPPNHASFSPRHEPESPLLSSDDMSGGDGRRRRGKITLTRNFDCEDQYMNGGDWI